MIFDTVIMQVACASYNGMGTSSLLQVPASDKSVPRRGSVLALHEGHEGHPSHRSCLIVQFCFAVYVVA